MTQGYAGSNILETFAHPHPLAPGQDSPFLLAPLRYSSTVESEGPLVGPLRGNWDNRAARKDALKEASAVKGRHRSRPSLRVEVVRDTSPEAQERVAEVLRMLLNPPARYLKRQEKNQGA